MKYSARLKSRLKGAPRPIDPRVIPQWTRFMRDGRVYVVTRVTATSITISGRWYWRLAAWFGRRLAILRAPAA